MLVHFLALVHCPIKKHICSVSNYPRVVHFSTTTFFYLGMFLSETITIIFSWISVNKNVLV